MIAYCKLLAVGSDKVTPVTDTAELYLHNLSGEHWGCVGISEGIISPPVSLLLVMTSKRSHSGMSLEDIFQEKIIFPSKTSACYSATKRQ